MWKRTYPALCRNLKRVFHTVFGRAGAIKNMPASRAASSASWRCRRGRAGPGGWARLRCVNKRLAKVKSFSGGVGRRLPREVAAVRSFSSGPVVGT